MWLLVLGLGCGSKKEEPKKDPPTLPVTTPDAAVAKVEPPPPDAPAQPIDNKPPPPVVKPVEGECNRKNEDVALALACDYRCRGKKEPEACAVGASKFYKGDGIKADPKRGEELVRLACELENADGCVYLARVDKDKADELTAKATTYYERDCTADQALACIELALRVGGFDLARAKTEYKKGLDLALAGCETGDGALCFAASKILDSNDLGIDKDVMRAAELRKRACESGHASTCMRLSAETDKAEKREPLVDKACTLGLLKACSTLAQDNAATSKTPRGVKAIKRACELGDGEWCVRIGEDFAKNDEKEKAIEMFTKACKLGAEMGCSQARQLGAK